jgi:hypothetical protein
VTSKERNRSISRKRTASGRTALLCESGRADFRVREGEVEKQNEVKTVLRRGGVGGGDNVGDKELVMKGLRANKMEGGG